MSESVPRHTHDHSFECLLFLILFIAVIGVCNANINHRMELEARIEQLEADATPNS